MPALPVILLMGPTASGKTGLALRLAQRLPVELVSVDSAQVYRGMDIGTAKPDRATLARHPHHLLDLLDPAQSYSAARFCSDALRLIGEIRARGRMPLLVGGSMLYFRALQQGFSELPAADPLIRQRLEAEAQRRGWPALHARLAALDPDTGARLHPNDSQRIQRALEIIERTGANATQAYALPRVSRLDGPVVKVALNPPERAELHRRIEQRFRGMIEAGLVEEVAGLKARGDLHPDLPSMRAVGYRQVWEHLDGATTLDEAIGKGIAATRQFAKRQLTWLRSEPAVQLLDPDDGALLDKVLTLLE
ncbi:MAG TPA: tRNA (adenosine(37)-N6)-dimethylallyltransferase MiaA [Solimonas sp.]|nr:tRNA (adenosine(37)-N6)-dimethylallyltransferase MiaA [Solimonas sp.]